MAENGFPSFSSFPSRSKPSSSSKPADQDNNRPAQGPSFSSFPERSKSSSSNNKRSREEEDAEYEAERRRRKKERQRQKEKEAAGFSSSDKRDRKRHRDEQSGQEYGLMKLDSSKRDDRDKHSQLFVPAPSKAPTSAQPATKEFFIDKKGDIDNLRYGGLHSAKVPRYRTGGYGTIIGLPDKIRISRDSVGSSKGLVLLVKGDDRHKGVHASKQTPYLSSQVPVKLIPTSKRESSTIKNQVSYVPLTTKIARAPSPSALPAHRAITNEEDLYYDADEGMDSPEDEDSEEDVVKEETIEDLVKRRTAEFEKHLAVNPTDIASWIEYSGLHRVLTSSMAKKGELMSSGSSRKIDADVTMALLQRAMKADDSNNNSVKLQRAYLQHAEQVWPPPKVTARWKKILQQLDTIQPPLDPREKMDLWLEYISWREGAGLGSAVMGKVDGDGEKGGGVDEVVGVYMECLGSVRDSLKKEGQDVESAEENMVYLLLRACLFLKQAGYTERAVAILQGMLELTFFKPDTLRRIPQTGPRIHHWLDSLLPSLEEFWDAESPRIGEQGALGWRAWAADPSAEVSLSAPTDDANDLDEIQDPYSRWYAAEKAAEAKGLRPSRATEMTMEDEEDPFRTVLFSDIQPFLFLIQSSEVKLQLIYAVINFFGLPLVPEGVAGTNTPFGSDPYLTWMMVSGEKARGQMWPPRPTSSRRITLEGEDSAVNLSDPLGCPVKFWSLGQDTLFPLGGKKWFSFLQTEGFNTAQVDIIRNTFNQLLPLVREPSFATAYLAFEASLNRKNASKVAKTLLSSSRDDLNLWSSYASLLSSQKGKLKEARQVYVTCLSIERKEEDREDEMKLFANWAEMEWVLSNGQEELMGRVLDIVLIAVGGDRSVLIKHLSESPIPNPTPPPLLKTSNRFTNLPHPLSHPLLRLKLLFTTLTSSLTSTLDSLQSYISLLPSTSPEAELSFQAGTFLLYHHLYTFRSPLRASVGRDFLEKAVERFPRNTMFLSVYLMGEVGGRIFGRVRKLMNEKVFIGASGSRSNGGPGIIPFLWGVWAEGQMASKTFWDPSGTGAERIRSILDKALSSNTSTTTTTTTTISNSSNNSTSSHGYGDEIKKSLNCWKVYIEFEVLQGRRERAKELIYRAIRELGGCKEIYLLPFTALLRPLFTPSELSQFTDLALERGIRLRIATEKFFDGQEGDGGGGGVIGISEGRDVDEYGRDLAEVGDRDRDDVLGFLREREVLKPY